MLRRALETLFSSTFPHKGPNFLKEVRSHINPDSGLCKIVVILDTIGAVESVKAASDIVYVNSLRSKSEC